MDELTTGGAVRDHAPARSGEALDAAYRYLNKRERTVAEVRRRLRREGFSERMIAQALEVLAAEGAVDDARFARLFTEDRRELEQWGSERIRRALANRGVDSETVASVVDGSREGTARTCETEAEPASVVDGSREGTARTCETEAERAFSLLRRRFPSPPRSRRDRDRALGVLVRKGYELELALEVLSAYARE
jgi:regulatory protein